MKFCSFSLAENGFTQNVIENENQLVFKPPKSTNDQFSTYYKIILNKGIYKIEAWGSVGGQWLGGGTPGNGAYAKGSIILPKKYNKLFLYIGNKKGFNCAEEGETSGAYGGGASDVRYISGDWNEFSSLKSRILVAAGGGGTEWAYSIGGYGGNITGATGYGEFHYSSQTSSSIYAYGGSQTPPTIPQYNVELDHNVFKPVSPGTFGVAIRPQSGDLGGGGGGGYYAGYSVDYAGAGGGGSSFISGHEGCKAILENSSDFDHIYHSETSIHYSGFIFHDTLIIPGNENAPHFNQATNDGNNEEGAIRITFLSFYVDQTCFSGFHLHVICFIYIHLFIT